MTGDIFVARYEHGEPVALSVASVRSFLAHVLESHVDEGHGRISTSDGGGADLYGIEPGSHAVLATRVEGDAAYDVVFNLAHSLGAVLMPADREVCVTEPQQVVHLPDSLMPGALFVDSGRELRAVAERRSDQTSR